MSIRFGEADLIVVWDVSQLFHNFCYPRLQVILLRKRILGRRSTISSSASLISEDMASFHQGLTFL